MKSLSIGEKFNILAQTGLPLLIKGMPGEAKTAYVNALAKVANRHIETVIASIRDSSEIGGLPIQKPEGIVLSPPAWARRLLLAGKVAAGETPETVCDVDKSFVEKVKNCVGGMVFFDEITCVMPAGQAALLRVIHEKVVGEMDLPQDTWMIAAANPPDVAANGWELSAPMANRFIHLDWELDLNAWVDGMINGFAPPKVTLLPKNWRDGIFSARSLISSFIRARQVLLRQFPTQAADRSGPWASPRSWDMAATVLAAARASGMDEPLSLVSCCVGDAVALEFATYCKNLDLPSPEELMANPEAIKWPTDRDDKAFAMISSVVACAIAGKTSEVWNSAWLVLESGVKAGKQDLCATFLKLMVNSKPKNATMPTRCLAIMAPILDKAGCLK